MKERRKKTAEETFQKKKKTLQKNSRDEKK